MLNINANWPKENQRFVAGSAVLLKTRDIHLNRIKTGTRKPQPRVKKHDP